MKIKGSRSKPLARPENSKHNLKVFRGRQKLLAFAYRGFKINRAKIPYNSIAHIIIHGKSIKLKLKETYIGVKNAIANKF